MSSILDEVSELVKFARQPFLVPDVKPVGVSAAVVFHIVRDMVDEGKLRHDENGYWRA